MNFNQPPNNGSQMPSLGYQQQQQQPKGLPMITPQLLASLNPQQLQQFKNHPQFQEIMRNYIQRQQSMQQGQGGAPPGMQQPMRQGIPTQHQIPQPGQPPVQQHPGMMSNQRNIPMNMMGQPPVNQGAIGGQGQRFVQNAAGPQQPPYQQANAPLPQFAPNVPQGSPPMINTQQKINPIISQPTIDPLIAPLLGQPLTASKESANAPHFSKEVLNKVPIRNLSSFNEWSDKLRAEGKDVPTDLQIYENVIARDSEFLNKYTKQADNNKQLMERLGKNIISYNHIKQLRMNAINVSSKGQLNNSIWGEGYQGYGNGTTNTSTKLILPERDFTDKQSNDRVLNNLKKPSNLVPIRLEFEQERDRFKLRDTFLWDLNEENITIDAFARQLVDDYKFIPKAYHETIFLSIKEQVADYQTKPTKTLGELRIPIKVEITINNTQLNDQFEWDILNFNDNDPEDFAATMCDEMNLPGEFSTAIAHTIREQTQLYHKALSLVGYSFDGSPIQEEEIRSHLLPALRLVRPDYTIADDFFSILRNPSTVSDFTPSLIKLTQLEVERLDKEIERESRRKRRHNLNEQDAATTGRGTTSRRTAFHAGRGGPTLPDLSDLPKTFRTPAPSSILPGAVDLGVPDVYEYTEVFVNKSQIKNPNKPPPPPIDRVRFHHDPLRGRFHVSIKTRTNRY